MNYSSPLHSLPDLCCQTAMQGFQHTCINILNSLPFLLPSPSPPPLRPFPLYCVPLVCIQIHSTHTHTHTHTHTAYKHDLNLPFVVSNHLSRSPPPSVLHALLPVSSQIICYASSAVLIGMLIIGFIERRNNLSQAYGAKLERSRVFFSATPALIAGPRSAARTADRPIILVFKWHPSESSGGVGSS